MAIVAWSVFSVFFLLNSSIRAQEYPEGYFRSPVDIPLRVSGTFAEFRYDHLHSGVDFPVPMNTPLRAVADGYISRIRMQAGGFGRALYMNHPVGYTSVYAHLERFSPSLEKFLLEEQYRENTFELDYFPDSLAFKFKKGEIIGYSGNSGISQGPHLHFELRRTIDENPTNPLLFKFPINDLRPPVIKNIKIYPVYANGKPIKGSQPVNIPMIKSGGKFKPKNPGLIKVAPFVFFGIQAADIDGSGNKNGLYALDVLLDSIVIYQTGMDNFSFDNFRAVNSLIDFPLYQKTKQFVQLTRIAPCNNLSIFKDSRNGGVFDLSDGKEHTVTIKLSDIQKNITEIVFKVMGTHIKEYSFPPRQHMDPEGVFPCNVSNDFVREDIRFHMPDGALYDTLELEYEKTPGRLGFYSSVHDLHNGYTPLNEMCVLSLKAYNLQAELEDKACIARVNPKGGISYMGGRYEKGWVTGLTRKFGSFAVVVDQTPPLIQPLVNKKGKRKVVSPGQLKFKIGDNFSGVQSYCGYVNGNWVLMQYDFKRHTLLYKYNEALKPGKNIFELVVTDKLGNQSFYTREIMR
ncbi:MAG: M23 family metallopeptidase [Bacteroidales bacterium]